MNNKLLLYKYRQNFKKEMYKTGVSPIDESFCHVHIHFFLETFPYFLLLKLLQCWMLTITMDKVSNNEASVCTAYLCCNNMFIEFLEHIKYRSNKSYTEI